MNDQRTLIIAEAGVNHNGDLELAKQLIDVAVEAGADIIKFQTFRSDRLVSPGAPKANYQHQTTGTGESQLEMVRRLELKEKDHDALIAHARDSGIKFLSTPFDTESIDMLVGKGITLGKVPSGEITNRPYLDTMARAFPELIVSTGMCSLAEVEAAFDILISAGAKKEKVTILHCNTEYPTPMADVNLRAMGTMGRTFNVAYGYSDHTMGIEVPIAAVALGASVIEKHLTLDRTMEGPDHRASLEPHEFKHMVQAIRNIESAMGDGIKRPSPSERPNILIARKSIHLKNDVPAGHIIKEDDLIMLRPGDGISPMKLDEVIGRRTVAHLSSGHKLRFEDLS